MFAMIIMTFILMVLGVYIEEILPYRSFKATEEDQANQNNKKEKDPTLVPMPLWIDPDKTDKLILPPNFQGKKEKTYLEMSLERKPAKLPELTWDLLPQPMQR